MEFAELSSMQSGYGVAKAGKSAADLSVAALCNCYLPAAAGVV